MNRPARPSAEGELDPRAALDHLEKRARRAQADLAGRTDAGDAVLGFLARHGAPATRAAVAANIAAPATANRLLACDAEEDVRVQLAIKIARLMPGLAREENRQIVDLTLETLEQLACDQAVRVRAILSEEIKHLASVPRDVVLRLASDLEEIVAAPVLEYSPLLSDADLMEIIACGKVRSALNAIARRRPLSAAVSDCLVQSLDVSAVASLLVNPDAHIRRETLERIAAEAENIAAWHLPLAMRTDLSARALRRIAGFLGSALLEKLAARSGLSESLRSHLGRQLRLRLAQEHESAAAARSVTKAMAEGDLGEAFVEAAALAGQRESVAQALAQTARVPVATVRRILAAGSARPVVALVWRAGLSMRVAFKIQSFIMRLPARELLPARDGVDFPLTADEMRWHLAYFAIDA